MSIIKEFFGFGGYERPPEGYMSVQHLIFASILTILMFALAIIFAVKYKNKSEAEKNKVIVFSAILIDAIELSRIILICIRISDPWRWLYMLPFFLCSIHFITMPLAAFSKGRVRAASLDFTAIFGLLGALMGTYFAGNNFSAYPILSIDNIASGLTHCIAGFFALYVLITGSAKLEKRNIPITLSILFGFCIAAYIANIFTDCNYMFLSRGDGTPYDIVFNFVGGNSVFYPLIVVLLFVIYIFAFYFLYYSIRKAPKKK